MATFRIGQRVRIVTPNPLFGLAEATVVRGLHLSRQGSMVYAVCVDGYGDTFPNGNAIGAEPADLAPLTPPHEAGQWPVIEALMPSLRDMRELA